MFETQYGVYIYSTVDLGYIEESWESLLIFNHGLLYTLLFVLKIKGLDPENKSRLKIKGLDPENKSRLKINGLDPETRADSKSMV